SRRRHTRCYRDWSSDVCSSDLPLRIVKTLAQRWPCSGAAGKGKKTRSITASDWKFTNASATAWKRTKKWSRFITIATPNLPKRRILLAAAMWLARAHRMKKGHWCAASSAHRVAPGLQRLKQENDEGERMGRFVGLLGLGSMIGLAYLFSTDRKAIRLSTVLWGLSL